MVSYHESVGESQYDGAKLSDDDGDADGEEFPIMMFLVENRSIVHIFLFEKSCKVTNFY